MSETETVTCPSCGRVHLNRLVDYCLYCSAVFPENLRLDDGQKDDLRQVHRQDLDRQRRERAEKAAARKAAQRKRAADQRGASDPFIPPPPSFD